MGLIEQVEIHLNKELVLDDCIKNLSRGHKMYLMTLESLGYEDVQLEK